MGLLQQSLWITLIGMGLVFIAVSILWGVMEGLMRLTARFAKEEESEIETVSEEEITELRPVLPTGSDQKKRAAAAAVAIAMALSKPVFKTAASQSSGSSWQTVNRTSQLNQPTHITRKTRGNVR